MTAEKLIRQYHKAMSLEVDFFASQPYTAPLRTINLLVVDFDDTCTTEDTTSRVSNAAIAAAMQKQSDEQAVAEARKAGEEQMQWLVQNYLERRSALLDEILPEVREGVVNSPSSCSIHHILFIDVLVDYHDANYFSCPPCRCAGLCMRSSPLIHLLALCRLMRRQKSSTWAGWGTF